MKLSKCCGSSFRQEEGSMFGKSYNICDKCGAFCDTIEQEEVKEDWIENKLKELDEMLSNENKFDSSSPFHSRYDNGRIGYLLADTKQFLRQSLTQQKEAIEKGWREKIDKTGKKLEIYCSEDTSRSVINMHGYNDGVKETVKELLK